MIPHLTPIATRAAQPSCFPDCLLCGRDTWDCECDPNEAAGARLVAAGLTPLPENKSSPIAWGMKA